jgi:hypothetical protein
MERASQATEQVPLRSAPVRIFAFTSYSNGRRNYGKQEKWQARKNRNLKKPKKAITGVHLVWDRAIAKRNKSVAETQKQTNKTRPGVGQKQTMGSHSVQLEAGTGPDQQKGR